MISCLQLLVWGMCGGVVASAGATWDTWQFWVVLCCLAAIDFLSTLKEKAK